MSTDPTHQSNGHKWTCEALYIHFEKALEAQKKLSASRYEAQEKERIAALEVLKEWRQNSNEWRKAMDDREKNFLPRTIGYIIGFGTLTTLIVEVAVLIARGT